MRAPHREVGGVAFRRRAGACPASLALLLGLIGGASPLCADEGSRAASEQAVGKGSASEKTRKESEAEKRFRAVLHFYERAENSKDMARALKVLRADAGKAPAVLVEALGSRSARVRSLAVELLCEGEPGEFTARVVRRGLADPSSAVRRCALRAATRLDEGGRDMLLEHYPGETAGANRAIVVDTLAERWGSRDLVPPLVGFLRNERDRKARRACVRALENVSGHGYGDDLDAWLAYVEKLRLTQQAVKLVPAAKQQGADK